MTAIPFALVRALCDAAGVDPDEVADILIKPQQVTFHGVNDIGQWWHHLPISREA